MIWKTIALLSVIYLLDFVNCDVYKSNVNSDEEDVFVPTHQWQVIREGQKIPKGLHVRINLQTGLKEAKLMDSNTETSERSSALSEVYQSEEEKEIQEDNLNSFNSEKLKEILKNIKSDEPQKLDPDVIKEKYKSYEQLKKELGELNLTLKSDMEILKELFAKFNSINSDKELDDDERDEEILYVLKDLEYLVHQIDNANEFVNMDGFHKIIYKSLNSTNVEIKREALNIFGASVQNNVKAQIHALETGAINLLTKLIALTNDNTVKIKTVYALSSLLRRFPLAQKNFVNNGGLNIFALMLSKSDDMKFHLKIITLILDLLVELKEASEDVNHPDFLEKAKQYKAVDLKNKLIDNEWCPIFSNALINNVNIERNDHDAIERCLDVMMLVEDNCKSVFNNVNLIKILEKLYNNYKTLADEEERDNSLGTYFINLKITTYKLLNNIKNYKIEL